MATSLVLLLLSLFALSSSAQVFVSIDCGAIVPYSDENSIVWSVEDDYIYTGESQAVQFNSSMPHVMNSLRVFSTRKKNCYSIKAEKGEQVLVRASFYYGNYDKKSSPPSFDLHFNGNYWATVETSSDQVVYYESIYVVNTDHVSVCVAQIFPDQLPFMSALEVRGLTPTMYSHVSSSYALFLRRRVAYGIKDTVRYADDAYDRIWAPAINAAGFLEVASDASLIDVNLHDSPPQAVLKNAFMANNASVIIRIGTNLPYSIEVPLYMNMYFSEVSQLDSTEKRSFELYINGESSSDPIIPPYGKAAEIYLANFSASSNTSFTLKATSDSTLPPLINALEVFTISDPLTNGTYSHDVEGLALLQSEFAILQEWTGDPCLPASYSWDWLNCSSDATPRVTALYLNSFGLSGSLPDFSSMDALETIDLHNNSLSGSIPNFLGTLPNLKELNLANNKFRGSIPASLSRNSQLKLVVTGNPDLCASGNSCQTTSDTGTSTDTGNSSPATPSSGSSSKKSNNLPIILGVTIPAFVLFWIIAGVFAIMHHKRKSAAIAASGTGNTGGANRHNYGTPQGIASNFQMGKMGQNANNEFKVNIGEHKGTASESGSDNE